MKGIGFLILILGLIVVYIGISGSQHRIMDIIKGTNKGPAPNQPQGNEGNAGPVIPQNPSGRMGGGGSGPAIDQSSGVNSLQITP